MGTLASKAAKTAKVTFQMFRRTFSTLAQKKAGLKDIQAQMRHSRPDTTAAIYMQAIPVQQKQAIQALEELIFGEMGGPIQCF
jgi:integrase